MLTHWKIALEKIRGFGLTFIGKQGILQILDK